MTTKLRLPKWSTCAWRPDLKITTYFTGTVISLRNLDRLVILRIVLARVGFGRMAMVKESLRRCLYWLRGLPSQNPSKDPKLVRSRRERESPKRIMGVRFFKGRRPKSWINPWVPLLKPLKQTSLKRIKILIWNSALLHTRRYLLNFNADQDLIFLEDNWEPSKAQYHRRNHAKTLQFRARSIGLPFHCRLKLLAGRNWTTDGVWRKMRRSSRWNSKH